VGGPALVPEPALARAASSAITRWTIVELFAKELVGAGPKAAPATSPAANTPAMSTPSARREGVGHCGGSVPRGLAPFASGCCGSWSLVIGGRGQPVFSIK
jgi:hypothetical protein